MNHMPKNPNIGINYSENDIKEIYFAGGCFWGVEAFLERIYGVIYTEVGYANGKIENPTYELVCKTNTEFAETVFVKYDSSKISLEALITQFFKIIDPTSFNKQGGDIGSQYRTGIYSQNEDDLITARKKIEQYVPLYDKPILVEVQKLINYYRAEDYHQKYLDNNPGGYCHINLNLLD